MDVLAQPTVAIVILNYNGRKHLETFLPSVLNSTYSNKRIIIADNASTDDSLTFLSTNFPTVEVIVNKTNEGFAGGYNWALKLIESKYYVLLNSDVEVTPNWIEPIISLMESNEFISACQPKLLSYNNKKFLEYAGACGGWIDKFGYPFSRGRIFDILEEDKKQYEQTEKIFWASGAAMFVRSDVFHQLSGFDASFFAHQEEIDLCWRMQLLGYKIMACPQSVVYHLGAGTLPRGGTKVYLNFRNNLIMLSKNLTISEKLTIIPFRFLLDAISAWKGLLQGDIDFFNAISKAHFSVICIWLKGLKGNSLTKIPFCKLDGVYNGSVVFQYFIKKKQFFQEIVNQK